PARVTEATWLIQDTFRARALQRGYDAATKVSGAPMRQSIIALALLAGCAQYQRTEVRNTLSDRGQVVREWYPNEDEDRLIVREGDRLTEYRIVNTPQGRAFAESLYAVDVVTKGCYAGPMMDVIDCERLRGDAEMARFLPGRPGKATPPPPPAPPS